MDTGLTGEFVVTPSDLKNVPNDLPRSEIARVFKTSLDMYQDKENYPDKNIQCKWKIFSMRGKTEVALVSVGGNPIYSGIRRMNEATYWESLRTFLLNNNYENRWVLVRDLKLIRKAFQSKSSASNYLEQGDFMTCVGHEEEPAILHQESILFNDIIPSDEDLNNDEREALKTGDFTPSRGFYLGSTNRRWLCLSVQIPSEKTPHYKPHFFLMDTGSPSSFMREYYLKKLTNSTSPLMLNINKKSVEIRTSEGCANTAVHNINLIGTDFLDRFRIVDCKGQNKLDIETVEPTSENIEEIPEELGENISVTHNQHEKSTIHQDISDILTDNFSAIRKGIANYFEKQAVEKTL